MKYTLQEIKNLYKSVFYLNEDFILDIIASIAIGTKFKGDPIWLLLIGGPSSGKSELVNILNKVPFVHPISSLTENTFLSNMRLGGGKEASLLHRIGLNGMITMKDYTSILSMRSEKREVILSQMREIYDGLIVKEAGNGESQKWGPGGKINWIGAVTEVVYLHENEAAGKGPRTINYIMPLQDRELTTRESLKNNQDIAEKREMIQDAFRDFICEFVETMPKELPELSPELTDEMIKVADFATMIRTPTKRDYHGNLILVPSAEMPMRVFQALQTLAKLLKLLHHGSEEGISDIVCRLAFDSIPKQRLLILRLLAKYDKVTSKGIATELRYPTETTRTWLEDINVLGVCERAGSQSVGPDFWVLREEYRELIEKNLHITRVPRDLSDGGSEDFVDDEIPPTWRNQNQGMIDDPGEIAELERNANEQAEDLFGR